MEQKKSRTAEVIRFALTGGVCFVVELAVLILLKGKFGVDTLIATPIAFLISVILNYLLCVVWVFRGAKNQGAGAKAGFLITSLIGLGLNELLMFLFRLILGEDAVILTVAGKTINMYVLNKCLATLIVMIWNYFSKRAVLYRKAKA
jgi:putative flippase GtrA